MSDALRFAMAADGTALAVREHRCPPGVSPRRAVVAVHAMMANGRYFDRPAGRGLGSTLARLGIEVFAVDLRGHGASVPPDPRQGGWGFDAYVRQDLPALLDAVAGWVGARPLDLGYLGHSLGGLAGLAFAGLHPAEAPGRMALLSTSLWQTRRGQYRWLSRAAALALYLGVARLVGHAPIRRLRMGSDDEPLDYVEDLVRFGRTGRWSSRDGTVDYAAGHGAITSEILAAWGGSDSYCHPADVDALLTGVDPGRVRRLAVSRATGFAFDADHFGLITDPRAAPFWDELGQFFG